MHDLALALGEVDELAEGVLLVLHPGPVGLGLAVSVVDDDTR